MQGNGQVAFRNPELLISDSDLHTVFIQVTLCACVSHNGTNGHTTVATLGVTVRPVGVCVQPDS